jgi:hypothetical protein
MDERIKKVAQKLHKSIKNYNDVSEVYEGVRTIALQQTDYFSHFGPDFLIKLTLYIYSLKTTGDFKLGEKMVNNLSFIQLISTNNIHSVSECKTCGGDGYTRCGRCKGYDVIECQNVMGMVKSFVDSVIRMMMNVMNVTEEDLKIAISVMAMVQ